MSYELVNPNIDTELYTRIELGPLDMNNDIYVNLKYNLKKKVLGKCNKHGYVMQVHQILEYENGIIEAENSNCSSIFDIKYSAKICILNENIKLVAKIIRMNKILILLTNGPILIIVKTSDLNKEIFNIGENNEIYHGDKVQLVVDNYVVVNITAQKFSVGDKNIKAMGHIEQMAKINEIDTMYFDYKILDNFNV